MADTQTQTETEDVKTEETQTEKTEDTRTDEQKLNDQYDYDDSLGDDDSSTDEKDKGDDKDAADGQKTADDTAGSEKEQEATETEKKSVISDELLARAEKMGFTRYEVTKYEAQSFSNAEDLKRTLDILEGVEAEAGGEDKKKTGKEDSQKEPEFKIDLNPDEYDEKVIKTFEGLNKFHTDRYSALETKLNQVLEAVGNDQAAAADVRFESMIEGLGDDFTETLGKGPGHSLDQKGTQFENRVKLHEEIVRIAAGYAALGQQVPTEKELFEKAVGVVFKDKQKTLEMDKLGKKLDKRSKQSLGRAAPRKDRELSPDQRATNYVNEFYKKNNIDLSEGPDNQDYF